MNKGFKSAITLLYCVTTISLQGSDSDSDDYYTPWPQQIEWKLNFIKDRLAVGCDEHASELINAFLKLPDISQEKKQEVLSLKAAGRKRLKTQSQAEQAACNKNNWEQDIVTPTAQGPAKKTQRKSKKKK